MALICVTDVINNTRLRPLAVSPGRSMTQLYLTSPSPSADSLKPHLKQPQQLIATSIETHVNIVAVDVTRRLSCTVQDKIENKTVDVRHTK